MSYEPEWCMRHNQEHPCSVCRAEAMPPIVVQPLSDLELTGLRDVCERQVSSVDGHLFETHMLVLRLLDEHSQLKKEHERNASLPRADNDRQQALEILGAAIGRMIPRFRANGTAVEHALATAAALDAERDRQAEARLAVIAAIDELRKKLRSVGACR